MNAPTPLERPPCGAKTRAGTPCKRAPATGRTRCKLHGGASLSGPASPTWKHGRYSKVLGPLREAFIEHLAREDLLAVAPDLALLDVVSGELLARALEGDSPGFRKDALALWRSFREAGASGDEGRTRALGMELDRLLTDGYSRSRALLEASDLARKRAGIAQSEKRNDLMAERNYTEATVLASYARIIALIQAALPGRPGSALVDRIASEVFSDGSGPRLVGAG